MHASAVGTGWVFFMSCSAIAAQRGLVLHRGLQGAACAASPTLVGLALARRTSHCAVPPTSCHALAAAAGGFWGEAAAPLVPPAPAPAQGRHTQPYTVGVAGGGAEPCAVATAAILARLVPTVQREVRAAAGSSSLP
jgi:hypothetical protein